MKVKVNFIIPQVEIDVVINEGTAYYRHIISVFKCTLRLCYY